MELTNTELPKAAATTQFSEEFQRIIDAAPKTESDISKNANYLEVDKTEANWRMWLKGIMKLLTK